MNDANATGANANAEQEILISEIFGPTIQGEGVLIGRPTVFVRTGGCDYRCSWCDTLYAVLPEHRGEWRKMSAQAILERVLDLSDGHPILVTLSGGNPALQPLKELIEIGHARGCTFALETQGSVAKDWFCSLDYLVLSPKPPSSKMQTDWGALQNCIDAAGNNARVTLKIVVFDEADYAFAREAHRRFSHLTMVLQIGTERESAHKMDASLALRVEWLLYQVARDGWFQVTVLPQLHVLLWGRKRGV